MTRLRSLRARAQELPRRPTSAAPTGLKTRAAGAAGGSGASPGSAASTSQSSSTFADRASGALHAGGDRIAAAAHAARLHLAATGAAISHGWHELPLIARQRIAAGLIVVGLLAIVIWVLIPAAPCAAPGGDECPATDDAISLVPDNALAYAHIDLDSGGDQLAAASAFADRLPLLSGMLLGSVSDVGGEPVNFATQIEPWAGDQAAVAVMPGGTSIWTVSMIEADDDDGARAFAASVLGPAAQTEDVGGVDVSVGARGQAAALVDGFLLLGSEGGVKEMIEGDDSGHLATAAVAAGISDLPSDRFAYAYVSGDGARALLSGPRFSSLNTFVNAPASEAITAALSFHGDVASLTIRSEQDPELAVTHPGFFSALPQFDPQLDSDVGPDALAYLGLGDPASSVSSLLDRARITAPSLVSAYDKASKDLSRSGGVSITDDLLPLLGSEAALSVEPVAGDQPSETPGVLAPAGVPYVSLLADGVDSKKAAQDLADLQKPLVAALAPKHGEAAGQVAAFEPLQIAGIEAQTLTVSPNVQLTYATYDDRLVAATKPIGIAQARAGGDGLADSDDYGAVTAGMPGDVSALTYFDIRDLLALGEQVGLAADPGYATLAPDLRSLRAAALSVDDTGDEIRTDLNLSVGDPIVTDSEDAPVGGE